MYSQTPVVYKPNLPTTTRPPPPIVDEPTGWKIPDDNRTASDYKLITFSGYSRASANTQLLKKLEQADYESAFYWSAELFCAGHWEDVYFTVLHYVTIHVNVGNVLLPGYIWMRLCTTKSIVEQESGAFLFRNNDDLRILMAELVTVAIMAKQTPPFAFLKLKPDIELSMNLMSSKLEATASYVEAILLPKDTDELRVPVNEFMHHLGYSRESANDQNAMMNACYWMEWILLFEQTCRSKKCPLDIQSRPFYNVSSHLQTEAVWILWDAIRKLVDQESPSPTQQYKQKAIFYLIQLFCYSYSRTNAKKRKPILYYAIAIATAHSFVDATLMDDPVLWEVLKSQLSKTYNLLKTADTTPTHSNPECLSNLDRAFLL
jgi:hypothetical protein